MTGMVVVDAMVHGTVKTTVASWRIVVELMACLWIHADGLDLQMG